MVVEDAAPRSPWERLVGTLRAMGRQVGPAAGIGTAALKRHPVWRGAVAEGRGVGVVVAPGFGGIDASMIVLRRWLARCGYRPVGAGLGMNLGCTEKMVDRLARRVEEHVERTGGPVVMVGHSRGGLLCRLLVVQRPELACGLVTLGSPVLNPLDVKGLAALALPWVLRASSIGVGGLIDQDCLDGPCRDLSAHGLAAELPVPAVAFFSRDDGVVGWESCRDPHADCIEVTSSHTGMGTDPVLYAALAPRLAGLAAAQRA